MINSLDEFFRREANKSSVTERMCLPTDQSWAESRRGMPTEFASSLARALLDKDTIAEIKRRLNVQMGEQNTAGDPELDETRRNTNNDATRQYPQQCACHCQEELETLRNMVLGCDKQLREHEKWFQTQKKVEDELRQEILALKTLVKHRADAGDANVMQVITPPDSMGPENVEEERKEVLEFATELGVLESKNDNEPDHSVPQPVKVTEAVDTSVPSPRIEPLNAATVADEPSSPLANSLE